MEVEPEVVKDYSCPVCDIWDTKENIRKHAMVHFKAEIEALINDRDYCDVCPKCPYELDRNHLGKRKKIVKTCLRFL